MNTSIVDVTGAWAQVVTDGEDFSIQNIGNGIVEVGYGETAAPPDNPEGITGIVLTKYKGITSTTFGLGNVYVKGSGQIVVSK